MSGFLQTAEGFEALAKRLATCPEITRYGPEEPGTLAHAFCDIEESVRKFLNEQLPKLADSSIQGDQLEDLLMDTREEFRHIVYHLHDPKFFRVLEPTHDWLALLEDSSHDE